MSMTRRQRLMATMRGESVDRPAVNFYEIDGWRQDPGSGDPYHIYTDPSWRPLLELARQRSDRIANEGMRFQATGQDPQEELRSWENWEDNGRKFARMTLRAGSRLLTQQTRRDRDINTVWTTEHLLKDADDLRAWLDLPEPAAVGEPDITQALAAEKDLGDDGIVMISIGDPLCQIAPLFEMGEYTVIAMSEPGLFHRALARAAQVIEAKVEKFSRALPGRLWRICGPEYAAPPYLPPSLFEEYVVGYDRSLVASIQATGGYARIHSHGRLKGILEMIASLGGDGLDPIEPPQQGDVSLAYVRERCGRDMVLFGNIEITDIENMPTEKFRQRVQTALDEGPGGRGFVLMPSACPYGRILSPLAVANYDCMLEMAGA